jgi:prevent-host-death family protein
LIVKTVDIREAQAQLSELVSLALEGNEVIITVNDKPLARLVPVSLPNQPRIAGLNKGQIWVSKDFDGPLPEEFCLGQVVLLQLRYCHPIPGGAFSGGCRDHQRVVGQVFSNSPS